MIAVIGDTDDLRILSLISVMLSNGERFNLLTEAVDVRRTTGDDVFCELFDGLVVLRLDRA